MNPHPSILACCWCLALVLLALGCTRPNEAVCCVSAEDCASIGVSDDSRTCREGLACEGHLCVVPDCSKNGCMASAPVCDLGSGVCNACTSSTQCSMFGTQDVCDTGTGSCVECVMASDCGTATPVCESGACRKCTLDSECGSGACQADGSCIAETAIVYVDPTGIDVGSCTRSMPCKTVAFGTSQTTDLRNHMVLAKADYVGGAPFQTTATSLFVHGHGATVEGGVEKFIVVKVPTTFRDLVIKTGPSNTAVVASAPTSLEKVDITGFTGVEADNFVTMRDATIHTAPTGIGIIINLGGNLTLDRAVIHGGDTAISANVNGPLNTSVDITNLLVFGTAGIGIDLPAASGTIQFSTIVSDRPPTATMTPRTVSCGLMLKVRASIVWDLNSDTSNPPIGGGCALTAMIVGVSGVVGASNVDPKFVAFPTDLHIAPNSPARDMVDTGPALDFERGPRPTGVRFDIGADETQ